MNESETEDPANRCGRRSEPMHRTVPTVFGLFLLVALGGCDRRAAAKFTYPKTSQVKVGLTEVQVSEFLGKPSEVSEPQKQKDGTLLREMTWMEGKRRFLVRFQ